MSTQNLCFEQKYEKYQNFLSENFQFLEVKFSIYLNMYVFVMFLCDDPDLPECQHGKLRILYRSFKQQLITCKK